MNLNKKTLRIVGVIFITILSCHSCKTDHDGSIIKFPKVSEAVAITSGPMEHLFASYFYFT